MKTALLLLTTIFGLATPLPLDVILKQAILRTNVVLRNSFYERLILDLLEDLREIMITGSDGVPVLDPFKLDELHLDESIVPLEGAHLTIKDLTLKELSTFEVDHLSVTMVSLLLQRHRVELEGTIPFLDVDVGNYDLFVSVSGFSLFGNGDAKIRIIQPKLKGHLIIGPRLSISGVYLRIVECELGLHLNAFEPQITGIFHDEAASNFVNVFLRSFVPEVVEFYEKEISDFLSNLVLEEGNDFLDTINVADLIRPD